jgi:hypothetical protein
MARKVHSVRAVRGGKIEIDGVDEPTAEIMVEAWGMDNYALVFLTDRGLDRLIAALTAVRDARRKGAGK